MLMSEASTAPSGKRILVLGATGVAGHMVATYLGEQSHTAHSGPARSRRPRGGGRSIPPTTRIPRLRPTAAGLVLRHVRFRNDCRGSIHSWIPSGDTSRFGGTPGGTRRRDDPDDWPRPRECGSGCPVPRSRRAFPASIPFEYEVADSTARTVSFILSTYRRYPQWTGRRPLRRPEG